MAAAWDSQHDAIIKSEAFSFTISIEASHSNTEEGTNSEKGVVVGDETGSELEDDEEQIVDNEGPVKGLAQESDTCTRWSFSVAGRPPVVYDPAGNVE